MSIWTNPIFGTLMLEAYKYHINRCENRFSVFKLEFHTGLIGVGSGVWVATNFGAKRDDTRVSPCAVNFRMGIDIFHAGGG